MAIHVSKSEFLVQTDELLQRIAASGESAFIFEEGRLIAELRSFAPLPTTSTEKLACATVLYSAEDIVSPLEADGYEPFSK
jgi:hypothetical protein